MLEPRSKLVAEAALASFHTPHMPCQTLKTKCCMTAFLHGQEFYEARSTAGNSSPYHSHQGSVLALGGF